MFFFQIGLMPMRYANAVKKGKKPATAPVYLNNYPNTYHLLQGKHNSVFFTNKTNSIGHVNEYPIVHHFGFPRHTQSMIAYRILTEYFWELQWKVALWECC